MTRSVRSKPEHDKDRSTKSRELVRSFLITDQRHFKEPPDGYVYVIRGSGGGAVKIGVASSPEIRMAELQCGNPDTLQIVALVGVVGKPAVYVEREAHRLAKFAHARGEWFHLDTEEAVGAILVACDRMECRALTCDEVRKWRNAVSRENMRDNELMRIRKMRLKLGMEVQPLG